MEAKYTIFAVLAVFLVLVTNPAFSAVSTREIDKVRNKGVLDSKDFQIIDNFVDQAVRELVKTRDFTSIAKARAVILSRNGSSRPNNQAQYIERFSESAYKHISKALADANTLKPQERKFKVILNLLILIDGLEDVRLADLAISKLNDESKVIRYWAVHSITNPGITKRLNSGSADDLKLSADIIKRLKESVKQAGPEIIALAAEFAANVNVTQGEDLLGQIADMRMSKYADWTVEYELLDATILKLLYSKVSSSGSVRPAAARSFGQLYSCAMQRYVKGRNYLRDTQKRQLSSVLAEIEKTCISKLLGSPQTEIRRALGRDDYTSLLLEHSRLLGDETRAGELSLKLNFNYGRNPDGSERTAPPALPQPPSKN